MIGARARVAVTGCLLVVATADTHPPVADHVCLHQSERAVREARKRIAAGAVSVLNNGSASKR